MNRTRTTFRLMALLAVAAAPLALAADRGPDGDDREGARRGPDRAARALGILRLDADHNGELTQSEIDTAKARAFDRASQHIGPRTDTDGDGALSDAELAVIQNKIDERFADAATNFAEIYPRALNRFDKNEDGLLQAEEMPEPRDLRENKRGRKPRGERPQHGGERDLSRIDTNGDGEISEDEKADARARFEQRRRQMRTIAALDADNSRSIDESELAKGLSMVSEGNPAADYNGDGQVTAEDATALIEFVENPPQRPERRQRGQRQPE